jgi:hypothetical protein
MGRLDFNRRPAKNDVKSIQEFSKHFLGCLTVVTNGSAEQTRTHEAEHTRHPALTHDPSSRQSLIETRDVNGRRLWRQWLRSAVTVAVIKERLVDIVSARLMANGNHLITIHCNVSSRTL